MEAAVKPVSDSANPLLQLAELLGAERKPLLDIWVVALRQNRQDGHVPKVDDEGLIDHLPHLFDDLVASLRGEPASAKQATDDARKHGQARWKQGYRLDQVLSELGITNRLLFEHGFDPFANAHPELNRETLRPTRETILRFFENTANGSAQQYLLRQQETAAELSELRRLALDSAQMGTWHFDLATQQVHWDDQFKAVFGVTDEELSLERTLTLLHPDDREGVRTALAAASRPDNPVPYAIEYRVAQPDGSWRWVQAHGKTYFQGEGAARRAVKLVGTVRDVTRSRTAQETLRAKEAASRFLADLSDATRQTADPDAVLGVVVDALREHLAVDRCVYAEVEEDEDTFVVRYDSTNPSSGSQSLAGRHRLSGFGSQMVPTLQAGKTMVVRDVATDPLMVDAQAAMAAIGLAAVVNVPLVKSGKLVAVLAVNHAQARDWTAEEVTLMEVVAERSWGEVERSRAVRELAFERHQLELIFQESPAAMTTWRGEDLVFTRVNPEYQDFFRGRQLLGKPLMEACPELTGQGFDDLLRQVLLTGEPFTGREMLAKVKRDKDGPLEDRYFDFTYLQIRDAEDRPWGVYDHAVDVTDRVQSRLALERSQDELRTALADREHLLAAEQAARGEAERVSRLKDEFLATLSHELRTPLNAILGWTQVLRDDPSHNEDTATGLATIERNAKVQTQIIEDLLDMSKIVSGKIRLNVERLDLAAVVEGAVETARPAATAKHIRLQTTIDPQVSTVSGDSARLQQVFWNLLSNAIKFTPKEGSVQVRLDRIDSHLEVRVIDSGEGIGPEFLPNVFDKFRQQDASTTRQHGGLGLGLAIVKQLVELHGGSVRVESAGKGRGTTFIVTLPLSVLQPVAAEPDPSEHHDRPNAEGASLSIPTELFRLEGVKVLVIDDEPDARALVKRLLEDRKAQVTTASSVAEAMEHFQTERPDVLVSDIGMPGEDGYALIRRVRALNPEQGGTIPALALTAYARPEDRLKVLMAGFQVHAAKPVDATELLALVATLSGRIGNL